MAALLAARVSTNSSCSSFRISVASSTALSSSLMPSSSASISLFSVATVSSASAMAFSRSEMSCSKAFFSSSFVSSSDSHHAFRDLQLQEARGAWQRLLEELQCVIIIQDLNCLRQGSELHSLHLLVLGPLLLLQL